MSERPMRRLLPYAQRRWRGWLTIFLATLASAGLALAYPWPLKLLVDEVIGHGRADLLPWVVAAELAVFGAGHAVDVVLTRLWVRVGQSMVYDLGVDVFSRVQRRSLAFHSRSNVGDVMSRVTGDSWCVHNLVEKAVLTPLHAVVMTVAMVVLMARIDPALTLVAVAAAPFVTGLSTLAGRPIQRAALAERELEGDMTAHVQQTLAGISVVQAFGQEARQRQRFVDFARAAIGARRRGLLARNANSLASGLASAIGAGVVLLVGTRHVLSHQLTLGDLLVFAAYLGLLQEQFRAFAGMYPALREARASASRVLEVLDAQPEVSDVPGAPPLSPVRGHVRFEGVTFGYEPDRPVLHDVSLEAEPGQTVAIVGPTGAGKSTLTSLVLRFFDPWSGRVTIDGADLREVQLASVRAQVGLVLQEPFLFPMSVADNIAYGRPGASRSEIVSAARAANAHAFITRLPDGFDTVIGERGMTLSGGERQRLSIARAILRNAPVLILDEPTSSLDAGTETLLFEALKRLMAGRTTFIIAHRLSTIHRADQIVVLEGGRVVEAGSHDELLGRAGLYARLHDLQTVGQ